MNGDTETATETATGTATEADKETDTDTELAMFCIRPIQLYSIVFRILNG
jgi:hypothetical protein